VDNQEQQDKLLLELEFIRTHNMLKPYHVDYLKTIDPDNQSNALRTVIDRDIRHGRREKIQNSLLVLMVFIILVLGVYQIIIL